MTFVLMNVSDEVSHSDCYGPVVQGGLLTHGHLSSKVDEKGSNNNFPLRQSTKNDLGIGLPRFSMKQRRKRSHILIIGFSEVCKDVGMKKCPGDAL